jgi:transketolase
MRVQFCDAMVARATDPKIIFLTGDLGFMALEPLQAALGGRFINSGVAEQNMISVAAAMAREGFEAWAYSIAPFCYARPFEQIRNDICFHNLPVRLVGNGGGYGYGVMGPTHHAIEDYGVMLTLPNMTVFTPVFDEDLSNVVNIAGDLNGPAYLRLGRGESPNGYSVPSYAPWRQLISGSGMVVIAIGPLAGSYVAACMALPESRRPNLWALAELPLARHGLPDKLLRQIIDGPGVCVAEEHVARGSFGAELALHLLGLGVHTAKYRHLHARSHQYERYGSQSYLRAQSGLDSKSLLDTIEVF